MTAVPRSALSAAVCVGSPGKHGADTPRMSLPNILDPEAMRLRFPDMWAAFLRENYRNPEAVAVAFGVRFQSAVNWWNATNRPTGDKVALAGRKFTDWMERKAS